MWWCSILVPGRIFVLLIACFIKFYVCRALQQKQQQHQCIIIICIADLYWVKIVDKFQSEIRISNVFEFKFQNQSSKIQTSFNILTCDQISFECA